MRLHVGTSGYSYKPWKGSFYPKGLPDRQMLRYYGERLGAVEINSSFYRMPTAEGLATWDGEVPAGFRFVLKAPRKITHERKLGDVADLTLKLIEASGALTEGRLGPLLFQLPPTMKKDAGRLRAFLALLPKHVRAAFEFRHPSWFDDEIFSLLRDHGATFCVADADDELDVPFEATSDWGYLRLRRPDYDDADLGEWVKRVQGQGWKDAFVFFKHEDEGKGPKLATQFLELASSAA